MDFPQGDQKVGELHHHWVEPGIEDVKELTVTDECLRGDTLPAIRKKRRSESKCLTERLPPEGQKKDGEDKQSE